MSYATELAAIDRTQQFVVELDLTYCDNEYADAMAPSTCTASDAGDGSRCYFTNITCQDRTNFRTSTSGLRTWRFCMQDRPHAVPGDDILPFVQSFRIAEQKIEMKPDRSITKNGKLTVTFLPADVPYAFDLAKDTHNTTTAGSFWRRFREIYREYTNRDIRLKQGFVEDGVAIGDYTTIWAGKITNMALTDAGGMSVEATDALVLAREEIPPPISDNNLVDGALGSGDLTITVDDASEITDPTSITDTVVLELDPDGDGNGPEYVNVSSISGNDLTVTRGRWGTSAVTHVDNTKFREVVYFGTEAATPSNPVTAKNALEIVEDQLLDRAGLTGSDVDSTAFDTAKDNWYPDSDFLRVVTEPTAIEDLISEIRRLLMLAVWVDKDGAVTCRALAPPLPSESGSVIELDDDSGLVEGSVHFTDNDKTRVTRVVVAYDLVSGGDAENFDDYQKSRIHILAGSEGANSFGDVKQEKILTEWLASTAGATATAIASRFANRLKHGARDGKFACELKDGDGLDTGDFARLTTTAIQDQHGATIDDRLLIITSKKISATNRVDFTCIDLSFLPGYAFWTADSQADFASATEQERQENGFFGDADNLVGTEKRDGYYIVG